MVVVRLFPYHTLSIVHSKQAKRRFGGTPISLSKNNPKFRNIYAKLEDKKTFQSNIAMSFMIF